MHRLSRPIILAHFLRDEDGLRLETLHHNIRLKGEGAELFEYLYEQATGHKTIAELATADFSESLLLSLANQLEQAGGCYEAHLLAQVGQRAAQYPDRRRILPDAQSVAQLTILPADPPGEFLAVDRSMVEMWPRETVREFTTQKLILAEVAQIAHAGYGIIEPVADFKRRVVPSAGAMYPLQMDYLFRRVEDAELGLYRWAKQRNGFIYLGAPSDERLTQAFMGDEWRQAAVIQIVSYDLARSAAKYASRAHRFALIEAGHATQGSMALAGDLGVGCWEYGGYVDESMLSMIQVDSVTGGMATIVFYGRTD